MNFMLVNFNKKEDYVKRIILKAPKDSCDHFKNLFDTATILRLS